jgi:hypothetical protein
MPPTKERGAIGRNEFKTYLYLKNKMNLEDLEFTETSAKFILSFYLIGMGWLLFNAYW